MADPDFDPLSGGSPANTLLEANPWGDLPTAPPGPRPPTMPRLGEELQSPSRPDALPPNAIPPQDKAAISRIMDPITRPKTTAEAPEAKQPRNAGLSSALDNRQKGLKAHAIAQPRHYSDLGKPPPDTVQPPHPAEIPNVLNSIGDWFSQTNFGSSMLSILGRQAKEQTDAFIFARQKSTKNEQEIAYNKMINSNLAVKNHVEGMLMDAAEAMGGDPKTLTQRLVAVARKWHSPDLEFKVTHGKAEDALQWLTELDRRYQDLNRANSTLKGVEEESNTEGDLAHPPDRPKDTKPEDSTDGGDTGNPYRTGGAPLIVPPTGADTGAGAPAQRPPTAPQPGAPDAGPTIVVPGAGAGPPADQGGFTPNINDTQGAAVSTPDVGGGVQVAEAGMNDLPPSWAGKVADITSTPTGTAAAAVAAQQDNYDLPEPASEVLRDPRFAKSGAPIRATDKINSAAQQALRNPGVIDELKKTGNPNLARLAERRMLEISDYLSSIAHSPHPSGPWVVRDIERAVPGLGNTVQQIANGSLPPPTARQQYGRDPYPKLIQMLVGKVDPAMASPQAYEGRYKNLMCFGPGGACGKQLTSNITAFQHIDGNVAILKELQSIPGWKDYLGRAAQSLPAESILGPLLRIPGQAGAAALGGEQGQRVQNLLNQYQINLDIAIAEGQRAASGAAPHEAGMDRLLAAMDITKNTESGAMAAAQQLTEMLSRRLQVQADMFVSSTGAKTKDGLLNYIAKYLPGGGYQTLTGQTVGPSLLTPEIRQFLSGGGGATTPQSIDDIMRKYGG